MSKKRKATEAATGGNENKPRTKRPWQTQREPSAKQADQSIEPGSAGIWVTCDMGKKGKCANEMLDLFEDYAAKLYEVPTSDEAKGEDHQATATAAADIEAEIQGELQDMAKPASDSLFTLIKGDTECIMFFKTRSPVEPVSFVHAIISDAARAITRKRSRFVRRLTPMTIMGKATEKGLEEVAQIVLAPHFHRSDQSPKKFAIRPTLRNHSILSRDAVIKQVAAAVGPGHKVDLKNYDLLILVELYKNICGISVVGSDYDSLKRYNLSEIYEPTSKPQVD